MWTSLTTPTRVRLYARMARSRVRPLLYPCRPQARCARLQISVNPHVHCYSACRWCRQRPSGGHHRSLVHGGLGDRSSSNALVGPSAAATALAPPITASCASRCRASPTSAPPPALLMLIHSSSCAAATNAAASSQTHRAAISCNCGRPLWELAWRPSAAGIAVAARHLALRLYVPWVLGWMPK